MVTFNVVLGDELRALRKSRGLTRRMLKARLPGDLSMQTLATYELGTRQASAERVYQICAALDEPIEDLYARVRKRIERPAVTGLVLNIATTVRLPQPGLEPIRAWAEAMLRANPERSHRVTLTEAALGNLAELCQVSAAELVMRLTRAGLARDEITTDDQDASAAPGA